ncbi:MAG: sialate O-acetylesterase [Bacillus sp. (in: Bacteria)]|nr:sialate O-acetylesterase [Bacillus sp. (in: firmicutes)]
MPYKLKVNGKEVDVTGTWKYRIGAETDPLEPQTFFHYWPSGLFKGMISPIQPYKIKGVLWYQGESNTGKPKGYSKLFEAMVNDWRKLWNIGDFPLIYTQLTNFGERNQSETNWAELREEQRACLNIPNTGMAVTIDIGEWNDLHPQDKKSVGKRLALAARNLAYGEELVHSGPIYTWKEVKGTEIILHFDHVGSGLVAKNGDLEQFQICDEEGNYLPAKAVISGNIVIVSNNEIKDPRHVRYAWANNPEGANLYNKEGLPASPFTTETL